MQVIRLYYISTMTMLIKNLFSAIETSDQGFNWTAEDYLIAFALVCILICVTVFIRRKVKSQRTRAPLIIAAIIIILLIGIDLGVGVFNFPWSGD